MLRDIWMIANQEVLTISYFAYKAFTLKY